MNAPFVGLLLCLLPLAACTQPPAASRSTGQKAHSKAQVPPQQKVSRQEAPAMSTKASTAIQPPQGPTLAPEQVWDKLFALIESLHSEADLTRAHVENAIRLTLYDRPGETYSQYVAGDTTAGWRYIFDLMTFTDEDIRVQLTTYRADHDELGNSPTCTFPMEALRGEMERRGFEEQDLTSDGDRVFLWQFSLLEFTVAVKYYFSGKDYDFEHTCVDFVQMAFTIPEYRGRFQSLGATPKQEELRLLQ